MNITLFGAAFDPPHLGHQAIATNLLLSKKTDAVWLVPVKEHPFNKRLASETDRLAMAQLLAAEIIADVQTKNPSFDPNCLRVETFELDEPGISYSYRTLTALSKRYPEHQFSFVIGSDNLSTFDKWDEYEAMVAQFPFFVYPRHGFPFAPLFANMTPLEDMEEVRVSSTQVRMQLQKGQSITELVPAKIQAYISQHRLYQAAD